RGPVHQRSAERNVVVYLHGPQGRLHAPGLRDGLPARWPAPVRDRRARPPVRGRDPQEHAVAEEVRRVRQGPQAERQEVTASASISTFQRSSSKPLTTTIVDTGRASFITSPLALPTGSLNAASVTNIRVRTTWSTEAPSSPSAPA